MPILDVKRLSGRHPDYRRVAHQRTTMSVKPFGVPRPEFSIAKCLFGGGQRHHGKGGGGITHEAPGVGVELPLFV